MAEILKPLSMKFSQPFFTNYNEFVITATYYFT